MLLLRRILGNIFHIVVSQRSGYPLNNFRTMSMTCHVYIEILETNTEVKTPKLPWWSFNTNGNDHIIIMAVLIKCYLFSIPENLMFMSYILYLLSVASIIITDIYKQQKNLHILLALAWFLFWRIHLVLMLSLDYFYLLKRQK